MSKIFIGCPISKYIINGEFSDKKFKNTIKKIYRICRGFSDDVFLALEREKYGKNLMIDECTKLDYLEMKSADIVVAVPDDSKGTAVELGWASCMKKNIVLLLDSEKYYTPLISGLNDITNTIILTYTKEIDDNILVELSEILNKLIEGDMNG